MGVRTFQPNMNTCIEYIYLQKGPQEHKHQLPCKHVLYLDTNQKNKLWPASSFNTQKVF